MGDIGDGEGVGSPKRRSCARQGGSGSTLNGLHIHVNTYAGATLFLYLRPGLLPLQYLPARSAVPGVECL